MELLRGEARKSLAACERDLAELVRGITPEHWDSVDQYVGALARLRRTRGHLITLRDVRYMDLERVAELETKARERAAPR